MAAEWKSLAVLAALLSLVSCASASPSTTFPLLRTTRGAEVRWAAARFPLTIDLSYEDGILSQMQTATEVERSCRGQVASIAREFNRVAKRELFRMQSKSGKPADVRIFTTARPDAVTVLDIDPKGTIRSALMDLPCWLFSRGLRTLIAHELLHVLGFDHNPDRFAVVAGEIRRHNRLPDVLGDDLRVLHDSGRDSGAWSLDTAIAGR